jgi:NAD(P)H-quinone oxidoreductase subunit 5
MLVLVLGLSWIIQLFAVRYLRADPRQVWFVVTANLLTATTALMVCATTVAGFAVAWIAAGISLVLLLRVYPHLTQARDGVRRTGVRLLIGDLALIAAVGMLLVAAGGDVAFRDLGTTAAGLSPLLVGAVAVLLVAPALARSSQVPFHGWLPSTLAAPTPVSALMHAGVVNAGAILILRFAPVVGESALAMSLIFAAGTLTLLLASVLRLVKPDVKGRLVYSTMAQMGFMMLACGLGAFAAAVFHLIAHGMFKSFLFLSAGSGVAREATQRAWPVAPTATWPRTISAVIVSASVAIASILAARALLGVELSPPTAALQLFVVFTATVALTAALKANFTATTIVLGSIGIAGLTFGYTALVVALEHALNIPPVSAGVPALWMLVPAAGLLLLHALPNGANTLMPRLYSRTLATATPVSTSFTDRKVQPQGASS